ncbi:MAG: hypothetical protein ACI8RZ_002758 [Myxococcota bacterium]|jgi:hypothetical protein
MQIPTCPVDAEKLTAEFHYTVSKRLRDTHRFEARRDAVQGKGSDEDLVSGWKA